MKDIKKTLALVKNELKCNTGGESIVVLMLTVMLICANIMITSISEYIGSLMYLMNSKAGNSVNILNSDYSVDFDAVRAYPEVEYGIAVNYYSEYSIGIYGVSEDLFDEDLSFLSKENIDAMKRGAEGNCFPMLVSKSTGYKIGKKGTLMNGNQYEVVGIIDHEEIKYIISPIMSFERFGIAVDNGQFKELTPTSSPIMFTGLAKGVDRAEFKEKYGTKILLTLNFDPLGVLSAEYSNSITLSVIGITTFTISLFGVIINCYLVFGNRRKYYRTLMTVGGKKEIFLRSGAVIKLFQLLISLAVSVVGLLLCNLIADDNVFNALGMLISALLAVLLIALSWFLLRRWLDKVSCLEN